MVQSSYNHDVMPNALVLTAAGINCDLELTRAFELAGATPQFVHLNELVADPNRLDAFDLIGLPGGFSYGDAIAAGRIVAQIIRQSLYPALVRAIERGVPIIAPCNGFQIAVQAGLLPGPAPGEPWPSTPARPTVALAANASARFIDRWCRIAVPAETRCIWTRGLAADADAAMLPIAHGEGRFVAESAIVRRLESTGQIALRYASDDNPNGSTADIAGICDASGLVLGLMPHPERYTTWAHHPFRARLDASLTQSPPSGLAMFRSAVEYVAAPTAATSAR